MWDIRSSPDVKLVKARSSDEHVVRYLGELTRCKSLSIETCIKPLARQSRFGRMRRFGASLHFAIASASIPATVWLKVREKTK
jgi:hypothetical protein